MFEYRMATEEDLMRLWEKDIAENPGDARYLRWREQYLAYNRRGEAHTFTVLSDGDPVGQITLLRSPECSAVRGRPLLCNGRDVGNMNAFRIEKPYEGQGHISHLVRMAEAHAASLGYRYLTIGCEAAETRTLAIYLHLGYREYVCHEVEDGTLVLYYQKRLG